MSIQKYLGKSTSDEEGCRVCGVCCEVFAAHLTVHEEDLDRWSGEGRDDLLERVGPEGELWLDPVTGVREELCPFLDRSDPAFMPCTIDRTKPKICRDYPTPAHLGRCVRGVLLVNTYQRKY